MPNNALTLASNFAPATDEQWREMVDATLRGKPYDKAMQRRTHDGITIDALYTHDNAKISPVVSKGEGGWDIRQSHWDGDAKAVNHALLSELQRGATSFSIFLVREAYPGLAISDLATAFEGVYLDIAIAQIMPGEDFEASCEALFSYIDSSASGANKAQVHMGCDPISVLANSGRLLTSLEEALDTSVAVAVKANAGYPAVKAFNVNGHVYHAAGASEAIELGAALATGIAYLRAMEAGGMNLSDAAKQITFNIAVSADLYMSVAKLRAARTLWAQVLKACGVSGVPMILNAMSATRMMTTRDPWVNVLRGTVACLGGAVGGADAITVFPHDGMLGIPTEFSERVARNVQVILQDESAIGAVNDPAAGSFAFESLTSELITKGWEEFQALEAAGGIVAELRAGHIQNRCADVVEGRRKNIAKRKTAITGVSEFPNIHEEPVMGKPWPPLNKTAVDAGETITALFGHRTAADFEALRSRSDACLASTGKRPAVFLANMGRIADFTARATFAKNFFEAGGIEAISNDGFANAAAIVAGFKASGAKAAVLCSRDAIYDEEGAGLIEALTAAGAIAVYVAGKPASLDGRAEPIFMGADVLSVLASAMDKLGDIS